MALAALADFDFSAGEQPDSGLEPRPLLEAWLTHQRHEFLRKLRDLALGRIIR